MRRLQLGVQGFCGTRYRRIPSLATIENERIASRSSRPGTLEQRSLLNSKFILIAALFLAGLPAGRISAQEGQILQQFPVSAADRVHFGDLIDVDVLGSFEYDWRGGLTPDGNLDIVENYPEPIFALCRTESEIAFDIEKLLGRTLRDPKVNVKILDRSNRAIARIDGAVRMPTRFQIKRRVHLRELVVMAGGLIDGASGEISIFRPVNQSCSAALQTSEKDNASSTTVIKIADLLAGKAGSDPVIFSGDVISVARALPIYVIGAVANPRPVYSRDKTTVSRLISTAGGLTKDADPSKVFIFRRSGLEVRSIDVDLNKIKKGETIDEVLQPFDIIEVAAKGGTKRKYPPVMADDQASGAIRSNPPLKIVD